MTTQNERFRALLTEARETLRDFAENWDCDSDAHKYGTTCRVCESREAQQRIDAALAEPDEHPMPPECAKCNEVAKDWWELQSENSTLKAAMKGTHWATDLIVKQRDEARAEVERLRWGNEMACENTPNPACQCPGCETARERADRGETGP